jgi:hypothetical protein
MKRGRAYWLFLPFGIPFMAAAWFITIQFGGREAHESLMVFMIAASVLFVAA